MDKQKAVASLGETSLVRPMLVREALRANDRLKLYLTVLQAAASHAAAPEKPALDLGQEIAAAALADRSDAAWLRDLPSMAAREHGSLLLPGFARVKQWLSADLDTMARPVLDDVDADPALGKRVDAWRRELQALAADELDDAALASLTKARRGEADSLHLLVMDLHKALHRVESRLQGRTIGGAHAWNLAADGSDEPRIEAFMRGVERTRAAKLDHPGLDTSATRDGDRLLIQNDIGTNDAHVIVLQIGGTAWTLTYSDLHRRRFAFFVRMLQDLGARWSALGERSTPGLNEDQAYHVGTATLANPDEESLLKSLEELGACIVFLIDWNRARKRLVAFVDTERAEALLHEAARGEFGHMSWLAMGGERLLWSAMAAQGDGAFRLGDRLDDVVGGDEARDWLLDVVGVAAQAVRRGQPASFVADEARVLLARRLRGRHGSFELLKEHAAWCHALAQGLRDGLAHGVERDLEAAQRLSERAKGWERQADELVMRARSRAERQPRWQPHARLLERADDIADALEEASFVLSLVADGHHHGWGRGVRESMQALAETVLVAVQDHVKAVSISAAGDGSGDDKVQALDALWRVVQAERQCDELLRHARRALAREAGDAASLHLGNELASAIERASDHLLAMGYALRQQALLREGVTA